MQRNVTTRTFERVTNQDPSWREVQQRRPGVNSFDRVTTWPGPLCATPYAEPGETLPCQLDRMVLKYFQVEVRPLPRVAPHPPPLTKAGTRPWAKSTSLCHVPGAPCALCSRSVAALKTQLATLIAFLRAWYSARARLDCSWLSPSCGELRREKCFACGRTSLSEGVES